MNIYDGKLILCVDNEHIVIGKFSYINETTNTCVISDARFIIPGNGVTINLEGIVNIATDIEAFKLFTKYMTAPIQSVLIPNVKYIFTVEDTIKSIYNSVTKNDKSVLKELNKERSPNVTRFKQNFDEESSWKF